MPYKNPEDKRQWEREHRVERSTRRRVQNAPAAQVVRNPAPDPVVDQKAKDTWKNNSWMRTRDRGRAATGDRRDQPARIAIGPASPVMFSQLALVCQTRYKLKYINGILYYRYFDILILTYE